MKYSNIYGHDTFGRFIKKTTIQDYIVVFVMGYVIPPMMAYGMTMHYLLTH